MRRPHHLSLGSSGIYYVRLRTPAACLVSGLMTPGVPVIAATPGDSLRGYSPTVDELLMPMPTCPAVPAPGYKQTVASSPSGSTRETGFPKAYAYVLTPPLSPIGSLCMYRSVVDS